MKIQHNVITLTLLALALLTGCSGGGGGGSAAASGPVTSTLSFPLQSAYKSLIANGLTKNSTITGTYSGSGSITAAPAITAATFEGVAALSSFGTITMSLSAPGTPPVVETYTNYYDSNYVPLGSNVVGAGWRGVNIDLDPVKIEAFKMVRPKDENLVYAIDKGAQGELRDCYSFGRYSLISTLDKEFAEKQRELGKQYVVRQVPVASLDYVLDRTRFAGRKIDLLSVDAEGHDLAILQSLSFEKYSPGLILVELHQYTIANVMASPLYEFLMGKDYGLVNWVGPTLVFKRKTA